MTIHLVNLTNPMMMKGPARESFPVGAQRVRLKLPEGRKPEKVQLLVGGGNLAFEVRGSVLDVTVPTVAVHEVVAIDF